MEGEQKRERERVGRAREEMEKERNEKKRIKHKPKERRSTEPDKRQTDRQTEVNRKTDVLKTHRRITPAGP